MLIKRGSRNFSSGADYLQLVAHATASQNIRQSVQHNLVIERLHLRPVPVPVLRFIDYEPLVL